MLENSGPILASNIDPESMLNFDRFVGATLESDLGHDKFRMSLLGVARRAVRGGVLLVWWLVLLWVGGPPVGGFWC